METPSTFLTLDTVRTLVGQVLVVVLLTQVVKSARPAITTYYLRLVAVVAGIGVHGVLVWHAGMEPSAYVLALANGALVAMTAMKTAELVKGDSAPPALAPPEELDPRVDPARDERS